MPGVSLCKPHSQTGQGRSYQIIIHFFSAWVPIDTSLHLLNITAKGLEVMNIFLICCGMNGGTGQTSVIWTSSLLFPPLNSVLGNDSGSASSLPSLSSSVGRRTTYYVQASDSDLLHIRVKEKDTRYPSRSSTASNLLIRLRLQTSNHSSGLTLPRFTLTMTSGPSVA